MSGRYPMPRQQESGANCGDLPAFVFDKYFYADGNSERFLSDVAKAICKRCAILEECREDALLGPRRQHAGVLAGATISEINRARAWQNYDNGNIDTPPHWGRPDWLPTSDAAQHLGEARAESSEGDQR